MPRHPPAASSVTATHILARKRGERVAMSSTASPVTSTRAFFTVPVKANRDLSSVMTGAPASEPTQTLADRPSDSGIVTGKSP